MPFGCRGLKCPANVAAEVHVCKSDGFGGGVGPVDGLLQGVPQGGDALVNGDSPDALGCRVPGGLLRAFALRGPGGFLLGGR